MVGPPSSGKSPALDAVLDPLTTIEAELATEYPDTLRQYHTDKVAAKARYDAWQATVEDAVEKGMPPPQISADAIEPEKPARPRLVITDPTIEAAAELLQQNPRGLLFHRDELSGWLQNFERRGGSDRSFWVEAYGGRPYTVDRVKRAEPLIIPALSVSVVGGVQPDRLASLLTSGDDDGLSSRFLYVWPNSVPFKRASMDLSTLMALSALQKLHSLPFAEDEAGKPTPRVVPFSEDAANDYVEWRKGQQAKEAKASGLLLSYMGKLPGVVVRLSLVLAYLDWAATPGSAEPDTISRGYVTTAAGLVDGYFEPMAARCLGDAALPRVLQDAAAVARWIARTPDLHEDKHNAVFNIRDLARTRGAPLRDGGRISAALVELEDAGWGRIVEGRTGVSSGRQRKDFHVNPMVFAALEAATE